MKPWHWKAAVGLAAYLAFIYTAQPAHDAVMAFGRHLHDVLFWQSGFFFVFPLVFILNAPTLHSKNPMHLLRLHRKSGVFKHDMKKMTVYSLVYVSIVTLFVLTASLLVGADMSASVVLGSFITSEFSALILSGFIVVCTMYIGHRYTVVVRTRLPLSCSSSVTFVMCRFNSRRAFAIWNLRSILGSSITFTLSLVAAILIGMAVLFHTVSGIGSEASWLLLINLCLTFAWIGHVAVYVSLRHGHFAAAVSGMMVLVAIFSIVMAFNGVATVTFSNPQAMAWGVVLSGAVYIATAVFLKVSLGNMDL